MNFQGANFVTGNAGLFIPQDLNPQIYCDPRNIDKNYTVVSNGTALSTLSNLGSIGSTFDQASGALQPTIENNVVNGNPVFRFNGSQSMTMSSFAGLNYAGAMSIFCVFSTSNANPSPIQRFISYPGSWTFANATNSVQFGMFGNGTYSLPGTPIANNTWYSTGGVYNGSSSTDFYVNGVKTTVAGAIAMGLLSVNLYFGSRDGTQHFLLGDVAFIFVKFSAMPDWQVNEMNLYLKNRFNL